LQLPLISKENVEELAVLAEEHIVKVDIPKYKDNSRNTNIIDDTNIEF
jgi:hypothetical protein